jgi:hypothetical protein
MRSSFRATCLVAIVGVAACAQERAPIRGTAGAGIGIGSGVSPSGGGASAEDGNDDQGQGGAPVVPVVEDCACLAAASDPACRSCLDEASVASCAAEVAACEAAEPGYCRLVLECLAGCPTADAYCVDACLGADDASRLAVEAFTTCACAGCAAACGAGDC